MPRFGVPLRFFLRFIAFALLFVLTASSSYSGRSLPHEAYVWQRQWTPALGGALKASARSVEGWRVLAAEATPGRGLQVFTIDWNALEAAGRPVTLVVRIDGRLPVVDEGLLVAISDLLKTARARGSRIAGIEIDHDCATARLPEYRRFLLALRARWEERTRLSITALPAWMSSPALGSLLEAVDESVLQVHAVQDPRRGLFEMEFARASVERYARRTARPFRVALPAYGTRVIWRDNGTLAAVESETPVLAGGSEGRELMADPRDLALLVSDLGHAAPPNLKGIVWFRLPTGEDRRAWSLATWQAVVAGRLPEGRVEARLVSGATPGLGEVLLANAGSGDAALPKRLRLPPGCVLADGVNGYALERAGGRFVLVRAQEGLLRGGRERAVGWARCAREEGQLEEGKLDVEE